MGIISCRNYAQPRLQHREREKALRRLQSQSAFRHIIDYTGLRIVDTTGNWGPEKRERDGTNKINNSLAVVIPWAELLTTSDKKKGSQLQMNCL